MMFFRALALLLALGSTALAQSGQMPAGTVWGNSTASKAIASAATVTALLDRAFGSTRGSILERGASGWALVGPGATAGFAYISAGAGADPSYARLGLLGGGTNADLSGTGGTSQFLRQNSVGATIDVVRPACADLSNAAASCSTDATNATNIGTGSLNILRFPSIAANTMIANWTAGAAVPLANTIPACANDGTHALVYVNGSGLACASMTSAGVSSIAGNSGAFTLSTGITNSTNDIRLDKATSANLEAGTASKALTADNIYDAEVTVTFSATQTLDFNTFLNARITATANTTSLTCSNIKASQSGVITWVQDGTGSRTMVAGWCSQFRWAGGSRGVLSTAINAIDALFYQCISTTICYVSLSKAEAN